MLQHSKRPNELISKLPTKPRRQRQVLRAKPCKITYLNLAFTSVLVSLGSHPSCSPVQRLPNKFDSLLHACNLVGNRSHRAISHFTHSMFQGQHRFTTILYKSRCVAHRSTLCRVECKLRKRQGNVPVGLTCSHQATKYLFNTAVETFRLPVGLRMVG